MLKEIKKNTTIATTAAPNISCIIVRME